MKAITGIEGGAFKFSDEVFEKSSLNRIQTKLLTVLFRRNAVNDIRELVALTKEPLDEINEALKQLAGMGKINIYETGCGTGAEFIYSSRPSLLKSARQKMGEVLSRLVI